MSEEQKPKVEGKKPRRPTKPQKKEYTTRMVGLEEDTFDIGHPKYAAKYERSVDAAAGVSIRSRGCSGNARDCHTHCDYASISVRPK